MIVVRRLLLALAGVLLVIAALFAFLPVPAQQLEVLGTSATFYCGPGSSSDPAFVVWVDPSITLGGSPRSNAPASINRLGESSCVAKAEDRLATALGFMVAAALCAVLAIWFIRYVFQGQPAAMSRGQLPAQRPPQGWYPDPADATFLRWWDGAQWTEHRSVRGPAP